MALGFTYPRTSSDGGKPVTAFKTELAKVIRVMADREVAYCIANLRRAGDVQKSGTKVATYEAIAEMIDNIVVEGE